MNFPDWSKSGQLSSIYIKVLCGFQEFMLFKYLLFNLVSFLVRIFPSFYFC